MPPVSEKQRRAMEAAAHGHSTLGIPKKVAEEFVGDADAPHAAGIVFVAPDGDVLLLRRASTEKNWAGHWALPGGKAEDGETPEEAADREVKEEIGDVPKGAMRLLDRRMTPNGFIFSTFAKPVEEKFTPVLNEEHSGYAWAPLSMLPRPLHPAVEEVLLALLSIDEGDGQGSPDNLATACANFAAWAREYVVAQDSIALDRATVRTIDADGHLHVERTPISKAVVNPYYGREIPDFERLGLDPDRIYRLYRHPDELARAAGSFEGKPLLIRHKPVNADEHPSELTVGTIGSPVNFDPPYLTAPLSIWEGEAIKLIQSGTQRELSCGYRYRPDMTAGTTPQGEAYDGVMRDIGGNHLALVEQGRAGPDVLVQDSAITPPPMEKYSMATKSQKARAAKVAAIKTALDGKLAQDANLDEVTKALLALDNMDPRGEDEDPDEDDEKKKAEDESEEDDDKDKKKAKDKGAKDKGAKDKETCDEDDDQAEDEEDDDKEEKVSKSAMDAAIRSSTSAVEKRIRQQFADIRIAEDEVRPYVGKIAIACDSAEDVYGHALKTMKVDISDVPKSAYRALLKALPVPKPATAELLPAMDAAAQDAYSKRFPNAGRLK